MEIGPITGVRSPSVLNVQRINSSETPAFVIDPSAKADDETYSSNSQTSERGLEEEQSSSPEEELDTRRGDLPPQPSAGGGINLFA